ncbi:MAG: helix-turn-helix transcriptional regulator [Lachnospiraceae bacterium]|nr:helix-turn-helix transcriptional regulator [Candidatus Equihabitans merdae]
MDKTSQDIFHFDTPEQVIGAKELDLLCNLIQSGNVYEARKRLETDLGKYLIPCDGSARDLRYHFIGYSAILGHEAAAAGVDEKESTAICSRASAALESPISQEAATDLLFQLFLQLTNLVSQTKTKGRNCLYVQQVRQYVSSHIKEPITTADVALALSVSRGHLSTIFKQETGESLSDYIRRAKIETACLLMHSGQGTLGHLAAELGFSSQSHFIRCFRKVTGVKPGEYLERRI